MQHRTVTDLIQTHGVDIDPHLDRDANVPVTNRPQRQGDVIVIPVSMLATGHGEASTPVPRGGVEVVRGEAGGHTHRLLAEGQVCYDVHDSRGSDLDLRLGVLTVASDSTAYLAHDEHGYAGIAPGTYVVRRQREQADEIRMVAD